MRRVLAVVLSGFLGLGVACSDDGGGSGEISGGADFAREKVLFVRVQCTCLAGGGDIVPENNPCVRQNVGSDTACEERVLDERWDELEAGGECMRDAYETTRECLLENMCNVEGCLGILQNETEQCPANVKTALAECVG
jgi:hypothetical protein